MEKLNRFFTDKNINSVLDVGTGSGDFLAVLKEAFGVAKITGVDPNLDALADAEKLYPDVSFKEMVGESLDFADFTFDVAAMSMALHHVSDVPLTLAEMQRIVKPGGWIIINELFSDNLNPAQEVHKAMHHFRSKIDRLNGVSHNETYTKQQILELIEAAGLEILLHFENRKPAKNPTSEEIDERLAKLNEMLVQVKDKPEFTELLKESKRIEAALKQHGFEMATCVVVVAAVK